MTTISIAMATYNGAEFIRAQLDSLAAQVFLPYELVVTDDGSTDETIDIIAEFSKTAPFPVHVHSNAQRLNYRANFMQCANRCSGDLIAFCDQDDIWDRDKLATVVEHFDDVNVDLIFHDFRLVDANGNPLTSAVPELFPSMLNQWTIIRGLTLAFRRTLLRYSDLWELSSDQLNPSECLAHDQWFVFLAYTFNSIRHLQQPLLSYRLHSANVYGVPEYSSHSETAKPTNLAVIANALFGRRNLAREKRSILYTHLFNYGNASRTRMNILQEIYQRERLKCEPHIRTQIEFYSAIANSLIPRASIYEHARLVARWKGFFYALKKQSYSFNARGLKDALLDVVYGILIPPNSERANSFP